MDLTDGKSSAPTVRLLQLPDELLVKIFKHIISPVGRSSRLSWPRPHADARRIRLIRQVCRHFDHIARFLVYQTMPFTKLVQPSLAGQLEHLRSNPDAARHIRHLACTATQPHLDGKFLDKFAEPSFLFFILSTYSAEFYSFLNDLMEQARQAVAAWPAMRVPKTVVYGLYYDLLAIYAFTVAQNVEAVELVVRGDFKHSLLGRFIDFCARQHSSPATVSNSTTGSAAGGDRWSSSAFLKAPLSRLRVLELASASELSAVDNNMVESLLSFPGLIECRTSGLSWRSKPPAPTYNVPYECGPAASTLRYLEISRAYFPRGPRDKNDRCGRVIGDAVLGSYGRSLRTLLIQVKSRELTGEELDSGMLDMDEEDVPRDKMDFDSLGDALRKHGSNLRRFELDLNDLEGSNLAAKVRGTLGNLCDELENLVLLRAPASRLMPIKDPDGDSDSDSDSGRDSGNNSGNDSDNDNDSEAKSEQDASSSDFQSEDDGFWSLSDFLPKSLRYLWTSLPAKPFFAVEDQADSRYVWPLEEMLDHESPATMPLLEWVLVSTGGSSALDILQPEPAYWAVEKLGSCHVLYRRRGGEDGCRNTLRDGQHPVEWREAIKDEMMRSPQKVGDTSWQ
ncbi:F-box-like domain-containing protein [Microdochium nivale]|nr:F-box-like domain-containing protein [Microdochium nivale]